MSEPLEGELQNPKTWDYEHAEFREPVKSSRVVVSVSFRREEFNIVLSSARQAEKKVSEFIREAAIDRARGSTGNLFELTSGGAGLNFFAAQIPSTTRAAAQVVQLDLTPAAIS